MALYFNYQCKSVKCFLFRFLFYKYCHRIWEGQAIGIGGLLFILYYLTTLCHRTKKKKKEISYVLFLFCVFRLSLSYIHYHICAQRERKAFSLGDVFSIISQNYYIFTFPFILLSTRSGFVGNESIRNSNI